MTSNTKIPDSNKKELRNFGLTMAAAIGGLFGLLLPWLFDRAWPVWPWIVAAPFLLLGIIAPGGLRSAFRIWMRFGVLIGRITTPIILGLFFYLVITPVGFVRRTINRSASYRGIDPSAETYKVTSKQPDSGHMERPF
ncbi:MAG: sxtJ [Alphaproteobacteria bacterium]|nr:sxtJ [Alphaproteobacteria bacterium]